MRNYAACRGEEVASDNVDTAKSQVRLDMIGLLEGIYDIIEFELRVMIHFLK